MRSVHTMFLTAPAAALLVVPCIATAQAARTAPAVGVTAGTLEFDLAGTGTRMFVGARAQIPITPLLLLEPGAIYMSYRERGLEEAPRHHLWFPEAQIQAQRAVGALRPYLGIGAGVALESVEGQRFTEATLSAALGARLPVAERLQRGFRAAGLRLPLQRGFVRFDPAERSSQHSVSPMEYGDFCRSRFS